MPQWGKKDSASVTGTVVLTNGSTTVTGNTSTTLNSEIRIGDNIFLSTANTAAGANTRYRVNAIANSTSITLDRTYAGTTNAAATIYYQQAPRTTVATRQRMRRIDVVGVDVTEAQVAANRAKGIKTPGWTIYQTYTDSAGKTRNKAEILVAMRSMTQAVAGDAGDDTTVADS